MIFWNHPIIFIQEGFLDFMIVGLINWVYLQEGSSSWDSSSLIFTNILTIFLLGICSVLFCFVTCYLWPKFGKLKTKKLKSKYRPAYEMIDLRHGHWTMLHPIFFMLRRVCFAVGVCVLHKYAAIQIFLLMGPTLAVMLILAGLKPLKGGSPINDLEIYNCVTLLCLTYCIMIFTSFGSEPEAKYTIGYFMVLIIYQNIIFNIFMVSKDPTRIMCIKCKLRWAKSGQLKDRLKLRAQKTKNIFSNKFGIGKQDRTRVSDALTDKTGRKLDTIGELSIESMASDEELKIECDKLGIDDHNLKTKDRTSNDIKNQIID